MPKIKISLEQFMVDYYPPEDFTEVQSIWLQDKLKKLHAGQIFIVKLQDKIEAYEKHIAYLKDKIKNLEPDVNLTKRTLDVCV